MNEFTKAFKVLIERITIAQKVRILQWIEDRSPDLQDLSFEEMLEEVIN